MSATQVQAANILLRKVLPDLSTTENTGETTVTFRIERVIHDIIDAKQQSNPIPAGFLKERAA